jgi:hypothetical protein
VVYLSLILLRLLKSICYTYLLVRNRVLYFVGIRLCGAETSFLSSALGDRIRRTPSSSQVAFLPPIQFCHIRQGCYYHLYSHYRFNYPAIFVISHVNIIAMSYGYLQIIIDNYSQSRTSTTWQRFCRSSLSHSGRATARSTRGSTSTRPMESSARLLPGD